ncbi:MAG: spore germination protein [Dysosmobacter sp.]
MTRWIRTCCGSSGASCWDWMSAPLSMAQESLAEAIRPKQWYNPFPKVRYTERPDAAAASIMEGSIVLMVDNSPSVMILPTGFFRFHTGIQ